MARAVEKSVRWDATEKRWRGEVRAQGQSVYVINSNKERTRLAVEYLALFMGEDRLGQWRRIWKLERRIARRREDV